MARPLSLPALLAQSEQQLEDRELRELTEEVSLEEAEEGGEGALPWTPSWLLRVGRWWKVGRESVAAAEALEAATAVLS